MATLTVETIRDGIYRLPIPIPFPTDPVNLYLVLRGEPTLVDTGPLTDEARDTLRAHLAAVGVPASSLRRIVITHGHVDHHGLLAEVAAQSGARVFAHEHDADDVFDFEIASRTVLEAQAALCRAWGYDERGVAGLGAYRRWLATLGAKVPRTNATLLSGDAGTLSGDGPEIRWYHTPGHTAGHIVLDLEGLLFSADHLLPNITPNPTAYAPPFRGRTSGLVDFVRSVEGLLRLGERLVLPGHGSPFPNLAGRVQEILSHHERRTASVLALIESGPPRTALEAARALFRPSDPTSEYLACREIFGYLEMLVESGRAAVTATDPAVRYRGT